MAKKDDDTAHQGRWIGCPLEEQYFGHERKIYRQQRKIAVGKDRSKFKKTDQDKEKKKAPITAKEGLKRGRVLSIASQGILIASDDGGRCTCFLRGVLKKEKGLHKNIVTVGDFVLFEPTQGNEGHIAVVEERKSVLSRADNLSRRKEQLIAANIDQVLITVSVVMPPLKPPLVDRYIIAAHKGNMTPVVVVNKIDLLDDPTVDEISRITAKELLDAFMHAYKLAGIKVIAVSIEKNSGLDELRAVMKDKASVFSGQSGVGKSSLINRVTGLNLPTRKAVEKTRKGAHTTTTAQLIPLQFGGWCIDTPGIKSFGLWDLTREEVEKYFYEIHASGEGCLFPDCSHTVEEDCAVIEAVNENKISPLRYDSYQNLLQSLAEEHKRR